MFRFWPNPIQNLNIYFLSKLTYIKWVCMTACQASSAFVNQMCYLLIAWSPLGEDHVASRDMDGRALNSLGTRIIVAVKVHQSQKKLFLSACFSALVCVVQSSSIHEEKWLPMHQVNRSRSSFVGVQACWISPGYKSSCQVVSVWLLSFLSCGAKSLVGRVPQCLWL